MNRIGIAVFIVALGVVGVLNSSAAVEPGFKESTERLKLLYTPAAAEEGQTPAPAPVVIDSTEDGTLIVTRRDSVDRSKFGFGSASEQTWRMNPADLDAKRVTTQHEPAGVFVPVKKNEKRISVERRETKARAATPDSPGTQWSQSERFSASFVVIPAADSKQAEDAADLIRRMIKTAPDTR